MLEKVIPIPILGKEFSAALYRLSNFLREHPRKAGVFIFLTGAASIWYEANVVNKDKIISPTVNNHLVYAVKQVKADPIDEVPASSAATTSPSSTTSQPYEPLPMSSYVVDPKEQERILEARHAMRAAKKPSIDEILANVPEGPKREELRAVLMKKQEQDRKAGNSAMVVKSGQLYVRDPHWQIRMNERNWTVLSRDHQQQQDHYWYRSERSRDDDFARNTYTK